MRLAAQWKPKMWTLDEYLALPEADAATGACPNCPGLHYGAVNVSQKAPPVYRCHGTEWPNSQNAEWVEACGTLFRGWPDQHFSATYYADFFTAAAAVPLKEPK